ncbi:twin-arginine translocase subunit TatC [Desulfoferrobacter suflitae]|uniref:twin-arginine translocase subunit TatC n=1 Tax=Desulfoferrobacter suflitae TaxID=2865782 RepID=UPI00216460E5|nr:twin-arginine translocase subunit TatC [Desulfoferrobacter suflitae]MCK8604318.1 twin-arginine translocase subunit TatC [Desulfoferrobacter suflitae]
MPEEKMPFTQHLEELRKRLIISAIAVAVGFVVSYFFKERIFEWLMRPLLQVLPEGESQKLIYTAPHEAFVTYLKVSFIAGVGLASPVIILQMWRFIAPGLYDNERRYLVPVVFFSTLFFVGGAMFGYFIVFPFGFQFFVSFANDFITPMISTREFTSFATRLLLAFGLVFEMPVFAFFLAKIGLLHAQFMRKQRKYAILLIFISAAVLTPPDVVSQLLMALPLLVLYEISVWIVAIFGKKGKAEEALKEGQPNSVG